MIKTFYTYGVTCLLAILFACQQESLTEATKGSFSVSLADEALLATTKAQQSISDETAKQFHLCIRNEAGYTLYDDAWTNQPIPAPEGSYTLEASMGKNADVAFDSPYYTGEAKATIQPKQAASVTIPCKVANALVSINWENKEALDQVFTNYGVKVVVNQASAQLTSSEPNRKVYLKAGEAVAFYFVGTLRSTSEEKTAQMTSDKLPQKLNAAQHLILTLKTDDRLAMQIEKAEIKTETINATIPLERLPKPKVTGFANQATSLTYTETADAIDARLAFTASHAIQDLEFTLDFGDEQLQSLNKTYLLSNLTEADKQSLSRAGITLNTQGTEGNIDLTQLTASLRTNKGEAVDNRITLRVKANDRWSSEAEAAPVYTIQTVKPEFSVSIDERNCWSREFTIDEVSIQTGNADKIKSNLTYQYFDGTSWIDCQTREAQKGRTQQFTKAAEELTKKSYPVRALYRGAVASTGDVTATLEEPTPIPNGDMEEWQIDNYLDYRDKKFYSFNPWAAGESSGFWDTNNLFTTRHRRNSSSATMYKYNGMPAVSLVPGRSGLAAELRSTANGRANTKFIGHTEQDYNKVAGELYTGTAKVKTGGNDANASSDTYERIKDSQFSSRPTTLQFWYKYLPFDESEKFSVLVELYDNEGNLMATNSVENGTNTGATWTMMQVPVDYTSNEKCAYLHILFCSTTVTGKNMKYKTCTYTLYKSLTDTYTYEPSYVGSVLTIDDIQLIYDK